jgi:hypothetical protein
MWERILLAACTVLLLAPQLRTRVGGWGGSHYGWATVDSGDEPHYLIMLNSVIRDGDLDLRNNYDAAARGDLEAGQAFAQRFIDRHITYWINGERKTQREVFYPYFQASQRRTLPGVDPALAQSPESPAHSPGVALLLAPLLFVFRDTVLLEPLACLCSALATLAAMFLFRRLLRCFTDSPWVVNVVMVATFLGTSVWYYSRTFFNEPYLVLAVVAAFTLVLRRGAFFSAGAVLAAIVLMKSPFILLGLPLAIPISRIPGWGERLKRVLRLGALPVAAALYTLWLNQKLYGSPFHGPQPFYWGHFKDGAYGFLFSVDRGIFRWAPITVPAVLGWPWLLRKKTLAAATLLAGFVVIFGVMSVWKYWDGGWCMGARLIVPALPLLCTGLAGTLQMKPGRHWAAWTTVGAVLLVSLAVNEELVRHYWHFKSEYTSIQNWWICWHGGQCE